MSSNRDTRVDPIVFVGDTGLVPVLVFGDPRLGTVSSNRDTRVDPIVFDGDTMLGTALKVI